FEGMRELSAAHFSSMEVIRSRSDFFRDLASSQYLRIAETVARGTRIGFDRLMGVFDKAILLVENAPPDLSFGSNVRAALLRTIEGGKVPVEAEAGLAEAVEEIAAARLEEAGSVGT